MVKKTRKKTRHEEYFLAQWYKRGKKEKAGTLIQPTCTPANQQMAKKFLNLRPMRA